VILQGVSVICLFLNAISFVRKICLLQSQSSISYKHAASFIVDVEDCMKKYFSYQKMLHLKKKEKSKKHPVDK
jgi:hypothetical protein